MEDGGSAAGGIIGALFGLAIGVGFYLFWCYCLKLIVEKMGGEPGILIWIPILQYIPLINAVGWETWKIVLLLIPLVNFVFGILLFLEILKKRNKPPVAILGLFVCFPLFVPWLAFSE